ncbi:hypothetical protein SDRG_02500 [Saprolegnia diclina VS20]|uniref:Uncharacterized protein n=1 Tax=Saprolegnia diclina (strain VS20) TaxID=1156394 RepID=T0QYS2_SAPDV|nr:hypothetical protein SDRG_02500 [Saprolegnia diclina VS20]EQC39841.1 hypothetical protein SDRG_02500 [Saprolegnia diclina VS20]|eukprot:XP_008606315.1 hypothetical protein SDRG_02500 [Saprolegnia diclina VS20]
MRTAAPSLLSCSSTASVTRSLRIWREYQWPDFRQRASSDSAPTAPRRRRRTCLLTFGLLLLGVLGIVAVVLTITTIVERALPVTATPTPAPHAPSATTTTAPAFSETKSPQATGSYTTPVPSSNDVGSMYAPDPYTIVFPLNSTQEVPRSTKVSRIVETESPTDEDDILLPEEVQVHTQLARLRNAMGMENVPFYSREIALRVGSLANSCSSFVNETALPQIARIRTVKCSADACIHTLGPIWTWFEAGFAQWNEAASECMQPASHACRALRGWLNPDLTDEENLRLYGS